MAIFNPILDRQTPNLNVVASRLENAIPELKTPQQEVQGYFQEFGYTLRETCRELCELAASTEVDKVKLEILKKIMLAYGIEDNKAVVVNPTINIQCDGEVKLQTVIFPER
jgi:hypothetical protein